MRAARRRHGSVSYTHLDVYKRQVLDNDTLFMPLVIFVAATVLVEALYAAFLLALGFDASALDVFLYRALPCALYDCVIGLVLYPLAARVLAGAAPAQPGTPRLR